jgi:SAM-dependent methyltransferase
MQSDVSHYDGLTYWGPTSEARMEAILDLVDLPAGATALDVGCGRAELLVRLVERYGVEAIGIDKSAAALAQARAEFETRAPDAGVSLLELEVSEYAPEPGSLDFISFLGGPFVGDSYPSTVRAFAEWLAPGGLLLSGHGFWMREPEPAYLEATGLPHDTLTDHTSNIECGYGAGFDVLYVSVSTRDEWDEFEGRIHYNRQMVPGDPELMEEKQRWFDAQQRWGRDTMGFALYLFKKR